MRLRRWAAPALVGAAVAVAVLLALHDRAEPAARAPVARAAIPPDGPAVFARMGCGSCHTFAPAHARGGIAPDLAAIVRDHDRASLRAAILRPGGDPVRFGYGGMPRDFGERLTRAELEALVGWLLAASP